MFVGAGKNVVGDVEECCCCEVLRAESMLVCGQLHIDEVLYEPFKQFGEGGE